MEAGYTTPEWTEPLPPEMDHTPWAPGLSHNRFRRPIEIHEEYWERHERAREASKSAQTAIMSTEAASERPEIEFSSDQMVLNQGLSFFTSFLQHDLSQSQSKPGSSGHVPIATEQQVRIEAKQCKIKQCSVTSVVPLEKPRQAVLEERPPRERSGKGGKRDRSQHTPSPQRTHSSKRARRDSVIESWREQ